MKPFISFTFLFVMTTACGLPEGTPGDDSSTALDQSLVFNTAQTGQILSFVNYPGNGLDALNATDMDGRAAQNIVRVRNGADAVAPSSDDVVFGSLAQLSSVPFVKAAALAKLAAYSAEHPAP